MERYVAMTCQTDDPDREASYPSFIRDIEPRLKPVQNEVRNRYLDSPFRNELPPTVTPSSACVWRTAARSSGSEFLARHGWPRLEQQYQKTMGAMTVNFQGQERTLAQMAPFLEQTDLAVRQSAFELSRRAQASRKRGAQRAVRSDAGSPHRGRPGGRLLQLCRFRLPPA